MFRRILSVAIEVGIHLTEIQEITQEISPIVDVMVIERCLVKCSFFAD